MCGRIQKLQPLVKSGKIRFSRRHRTLLEQLRKSPEAAHDDGLDSERFDAYIDHLLYRIDKKGDASAKGELKAMLRQVSGWAKHPIKSDSYEAELVMEKLADRFESDNINKNNMSDFIRFLENTREGDTETEDITDALDVLFQQATGIKEPTGTDAPDEMSDRIFSITRIGEVEAFGEDDLPALSDAVSRLADMPGKGSLGTRSKASCAWNRSSRMQTWASW